MPSSSSRRRDSASPEPRRSRHDAEDERKDRSSRSHRRHHEKDDTDNHRDGDERQGEENNEEDDVLDARVLQLGSHALSQDHFFQKSAEFKQWLRSSRKKYLDELSSREARRYFDKFVRRWNAGELEDDYYLGKIRTTGSSASSQTRHKWGFTASKLTKEEQDLLETTRDTVATLTDGTSRGAIEAREVERKLGKGKRMTERDGEAQRDQDEGTSSNAGARDSGWGGASSSAAGPRESQYDREERQEREKRQRQGERRRDNREAREDLDELAPRATGREAMFERKREVRASNRAFADRRDGEDGFDIDEGVLLGGGGSRGKGGDDFRSAVAERNQAAARARDRGQERERARQQQAADSGNNERLTAMKQKESDTMAMFKAMAQQRFGAG
ncbi:hypothetical protein OC845_000405 [Tilletia horrida]|nr:hypothetical protein OC845_000405 [Tilletia horrida]